MFKTRGSIVMLVVSATLLLGACGSPKATACQQDRAAQAQGISLEARC